MNKLTLSFLAVSMCLIGLADSSKAQTYNSADTPTPYLTTTTSTINVPGAPSSITDVNIDISFSSITNNDRKYAISLLSPNGTTVDIIDLNLTNTATGGALAQNYIFDDAAAAAWIGPAMNFSPMPANGTYRLQAGLDFLSDFNGENPLGNWVITLYGGPNSNNTRIDAWALIFTLGPPIVIPAAVAGGGRGGGSRQAETTYLVDARAMYSLTNSGLPMGLALRDVSRGAAYAASKNLGDRLGRAQSRGFGQGNAVTNNNSSSLLRYLAFVGDENMSYKVALGLADPEERTIEVNMVDTLSAQVGTNFNGQTMAGGLPYAMMGVPMMPMAGGAATVHVVEAAPSGKTVIDDAKAVVEDTVWKRWELFASGDFSFYDQDQLSDLMEGFETDTYAGSVGLEYRAKEWLNLGLAWTYLDSDTNVSGDLGNIDLEGNLISGYATAFWRQNWMDILYSYGSFNSDVARNTGFGSTAHGDTDSDSHNVRLNIGRNIQGGENVLTGPVAGLRYSNGGVDPYSETGGGSAALNYNGTEFESMVSRVGWQASHVKPTGWGRIVSQVHLAWEHEFMPENGTVGAGLQTSPFSAVTGGSVRRFGGFSSESDGAHPGTDWMSAGAGLRFELDNGLSIRTDYEGVFFRANASQHYGSLKVGYEW